MRSSIDNTNNHHNNNNSTSSIIHNHPQYQRNRNNIINNNNSPNITTTFCSRRSVIVVIERVITQLLVSSSRQPTRSILVILCGCYFFIIIWRFTQSMDHVATPNKQSVVPPKTWKFSDSLSSMLNQTTIITTATTSLSDRICLRGIQSIVDAKIQLVAFDFDETIINIHTGGMWNGPSSVLVEHVRPEMICVLYECIYTYKIPVAITTFSTQKQLLTNVLQQAIINYRANELHPEEDTENDDKHPSPPPAIPIFGWDDRVQGYDFGKQSQLLLARQYYNTNYYNSIHSNSDIQPNDRQSVRRQQQQQFPKDQDMVPSRDRTVLIDDDYENIRIARIDGYRTVHYNLEQTTNENALVLDHKPKG